MGQADGKLRRRTVLGGAAAATLAGALASACAAPAPGRRGTLDDVEHVVVLMQENRSFDHYYGTMAGVRGVGDRVPVRLAGGGTVFDQPAPGRPGGALRPFRVDTSRVDGQDLGELPHDWNSTHLAWNDGAHDAWVRVKSGMTMGCFNHTDIPFQRALASAFTLCDNYFCSMQGPTLPNRLYHWTGTVDPEGVAGGPATHNPPDYEPSYRWTTYPERLQAAGVSWQVYANDEVRGVPEGFVGDYGDNPLWLFKNYHDALSSWDPVKRELAERANLRTHFQPDSGQGHNVDHVLTQFLGACQAGTLPAVSWIVAPYGYCEHPAARPVDGAAYLQRVLRALWDNPKLWESTVVFVNYDENDGFFDHVVPPTAPPGTPGEMLSANRPADGRAPSGPPVPIGLGPRVPMTVISPWSRGGWINSQVFDHTSVLRFLEVWTGVREPNISAWRRNICGDLISCFDFRTHDPTIPLLPDAHELRTQADAAPKLPRPSVPAPGAEIAAVQEPGTAKARPLPYQPVASVKVSAARLDLRLANHGTAALQLSCHAYHRPAPPLRIDVDAQATASATIPFTTTYDVAIHGPNGFLAEAAGDAADVGLDATAELSGPAPALTITVTNALATPVTIAGAVVAAGASHAVTLDPLKDAYGWYDVTLTTPEHPAWRRRFTGHLEDGRPSRTG